LQLNVYQQLQPWTQSESDINYSNTIAEVDDNLIAQRPAGPPVEMFDFVYVDVSTAVANPAGGKISLRLSTNKEIYFASKESVEAKPEIRLLTCSDWMNTVSPQFKTQPTFPTNVPTTEPVIQPPSMRRSLSAELDTYVIDKSKRSNYGSNKVLYSTDDGKPMKRILFQFDVPMGFADSKSNVCLKVVAGSRDGYSNTDLGLFQLQEPLGNEDEINFENSWSNKRKKQVGGIKEGVSDVSDVYFDVTGVLTSFGGKYPFEVTTMNEEVEVKMSSKEGVNGPELMLGPCPTF